MPPPWRSANGSRRGHCSRIAATILDPALAWTGVKDSGRGCTLSSVGYESLTRPKSYHLRRGSHVATRHA